MNKFTLPISPEYVAHWGLWEAIREIYQNALDEQTHDPTCIAKIEYEDDVAQGILRITTSKGQLSPETLVLGKTSKRDDQDQRGKFGEGYKLALLVLCRLKTHGVEILSGSEKWTARLEHDETFNSTVLNIYTEPHEEHKGVQFLVGGILPSDWKMIQKNIHASSKDSKLSWILEEPQEKGRIYVGSLYVSTAKDFHCGYSFPPGIIKLDRDRGMVNGFDLSYETSRLWVDRKSNRALELLRTQAPDVRYIEAHASSEKPLVNHQYRYFVAKHGPAAVPVSSQDEIERATSAGMKWVLVPETVKTLLRKVKSWFIPSTKTPAERLRAFRESYSWNMDSTMLQELDEIIQSLDPSQP
jgi:hypothetical protein